MLVLSLMAADKSVKRKSAFITPTVHFCLPEAS